MRFLYFVFLGCFLFSCKPNSSDSEVTTQVVEKVEEVILPAPPTLENQKPIDGAWADYWSRMQAAAKSKSRSLMTSMIYFPFPIGDGQLIRAEDYPPYHEEVFGRNVIRKIMTTKAIDIDSYKLYGAEFNNSMASKMGLKEGVKVYKMNIDKFTQEEGVLKNTGVNYYHFPKFERGGYRLGWIEKANQ